MRLSLLTSSTPSRVEVFGVRSGRKRILIQPGEITMLYDGDDDRVQKGVAEFSGGPAESAGYPQPLRENFYHNGGGDQEIAHRSYYGLERLL